MGFKGEKNGYRCSTHNGCNLMLTGMVGVFVFLSILIGAVTLMSNLVTRFSEPEASPVKSPSFKSQGVPNEHIAAISAAIAQYKSNNK